ncbi:hypothetical protein KUTeg_017336 [Tegillarca granosa]|uniref:Potassium channel domain-containing protein n=1 Tax=Tegillarca granosa TaxID=220873 RepID=A0ABQ9EML3_TEGGR|nr:hypothetical protein KUTeg_017336 [Tegillarca granosa]
MEKFIFAIVKATNRGVSAIRNVTMSEPNWSFGQSMFFAGTVLTTIGYGRVTPLSDAGKAFCILFALIGIPLTLILFSALVERLMIPTKMLLYFLFRKLGHLYKVLHIQILHLFIVIAFVVVFMVVIPAGIYSALEPKWNYLDAFYYCFISLTTIGLGDYIPGDSPEQKLNLGFHFYMKSDGQDEEHASLRGNADGPKYTKQIDDDQPNQQYSRSYQQESGPGIAEQ